LKKVLVAKHFCYSIPALSDFCCSVVDYHQCYCVALFSLLSVPATSDKKAQRLTNQDGRSRIMKELMHNEMSLKVLMEF